jgi:NTP pyrophosphatase (non-canonical NTP hydrolase)
MKLKIPASELKHLASVEFGLDHFDEEAEEFFDAMEKYVKTGKRSDLDAAMLELADMVRVYVSFCLHNIDSEVLGYERQRVENAIMCMTDFLHCQPSVVIDVLTEYITAKGAIVRASLSLIN